MKLAGILFDKDGTLVDFDRTWGVAAHAVISTMSFGDPAVYARLATAMHFVAEERRFEPTSPMIAGSTADYVHLWGEILDRADDPGLSAEIDRHFSREALAALVPVERPAEILGFCTRGASGSASPRTMRKPARGRRLIAWVCFPFWIFSSAMIRVTAASRSPEW